MIATLPSKLETWQNLVAVDSDGITTTTTDPVIQSLGCSQDALKDFNETLTRVAPGGIVEIWSPIEAYEAAETLQQLLGEPRITPESHG